MSSARYFLCKNAYCCETRGYWIVLDVASDEYLCIGRRAADTLRPWLRFKYEPTGETLESPPKDVANLATALVRKGILSENAQDARQSSDEPIVLATEAFKNKIFVPRLSTLSYVAAFFLASARASKCLGNRSLNQNVLHVRERRSRRRVHHMPFDFQKARRLVAVFNALRLFYPRTHLCMFESLALIEFLAYFNLFPAWVFAVSADPFQAHCWVQEDHVLLNDSIARISSFTPIMKV
jgi:hypothetical protein